MSGGSDCVIGSTPPVWYRQTAISSMTSLLRSDKTDTRAGTPESRGVTKFPGGVGIVAGVCTQSLATTWALTAGSPKNLASPEPRRASSCSCLSRGLPYNNQLYFLLLPCVSGTGFVLFRRVWYGQSSAWRGSPQGWTEKTPDASQDSSPQVKSAEIQNFSAPVVTDLARQL